MRNFKVLLVQITLVYFFWGGQSELGSPLMKYSNSFELVQSPEPQAPKTLGPRREDLDLSKAFHCMGLERENNAGYGTAV